MSCSPETCIPAWAHPTRAWNTPACHRRPPWKPWCDQKPVGHEPWDKIRFGFDFTANVTQPQTRFYQVNLSNLRSVWRWCEPLLCWCLRRCPCGLLLSRCSILDILSVSTSRKSKNKSQDKSVVRSWSGLFLLATIGNILNKIRLGSRATGSFERTHDSGQLGNEPVNRRLTQHYLQGKRRPESFYMCARSLVDFQGEREMEKSERNSYLNTAVFQILYPNVTK